MKLNNGLVGSNGDAVSGNGGAVSGKGDIIYGGNTINFEVQNLKIINLENALSSSSGTDINDITGEGVRFLENALRPSPSIFNITEWSVGNLTEQFKKIKEFIYKLNKGDDILPLIQWIDTAGFLNNVEAFSAACVSNCSLLVEYLISRDELKSETIKDALSNKGCKQGILKHIKETPGLIKLIIEKDADIIRPIISIYGLKYNKIEGTRELVLNLLNNIKNVEAINIISECVINEKVIEIPICDILSKNPVAGVLYINKYLNLHSEIEAHSFIKEVMEDFLENKIQINDNDSKILEMLLSCFNSEQVTISNRHNDLVKEILKCHNNLMLEPAKINEQISKKIMFAVIKNLNSISNESLENFYCKFFNFDFTKAEELCDTTTKQSNYIRDMNCSETTSTFYKNLVVSIFKDNIEVLSPFGIIFPSKNLGSIEFINEINRSCNDAKEQVKKLKEEIRSLDIIGKKEFSNALYLKVIKNVFQTKCSLDDKNGAKLYKEIEQIIDANCDNEIQIKMHALFQELCHCDGILGKDSDIHDPLIKGAKLKEAIYNNNYAMFIEKLKAFSTEKIEKICDNLKTEEAHDFLQNIADRVNDLLSITKNIPLLYSKIKDLDVARIEFEQQTPIEQNKNQTFEEEKQEIHEDKIISNEEPSTELDTNLCGDCGALNCDGLYCDNEEPSTELDTNLCGDCGALNCDGLYCDN